MQRGCTKWRGGALGGVGPRNRGSVQLLVHTSRCTGRVSAELKHKPDGQLELWKF